MTLPVSELEASVCFYTNVLGFTESLRYEPTQWVAFEVGEVGFAIMEVWSGEALQRGMIDFFVDDVDAVFARVGDRAAILQQPRTTAWGSYKGVLADPDGNCLGFVRRC